MNTYTNYARRLSVALEERGLKLNHRQVLDLLARMEGHRDWRTKQGVAAMERPLMDLNAPPLPVPPGGKLVPLRQWVCDTCGQVIERPEHGYVLIHFTTENRRTLLTGFSIVHHTTHSPLRDTPARDCYGEHPGKDQPLVDLVGENGMAHLLSYVDVGEHNGDVAQSRMHPDRMREWVTLVRRLTIPHYEEGRQYLPHAMRDGRVDSHEIRPYQQRSLLNWLEDYGEEPDETTGGLGKSASGVDGC